MASGFVRGVDDVVIGERLFLSYAHEDRDRTRRVADRLRASGWDVWTDQRIKGGARWADELHAAIRTCRVFVVLLTPDSMHSSYVHNELHIAVDTHRPVVPVMLEDAVLTPGAQLLLADRQIVDCTDETAWQYQDVLTAISAAARGPRRHGVSQRRWVRWFSVPLSVVGVLLILGGFGAFFLNLARVASDPGGPGDLPSGAPFVLAIFTAFVGMVLATAATALQRWSRRR